jgi:flagellar hook-associated protein 3 FlgL
VINRIGSGQLSRNFLAAMNDGQAKLADLQNQLSTGKRISNPSDDPVGVGRALAIRGDQASVAAWKANVADSKDWLSATDNALGNYLQIVQRAGELAVQGVNGTLSVPARQQIATEILALRDQVAEAGNASLGGRYLFGGTRTDRPPFATGSPPALAAPVNTGLLNREVGQGQVMSVNITADRVIDPPGATPDILTTLTGMATALQNGDLNAVSTVSMVDLTAHIDNVNSLRGEVGAKVNRMELTETRFAIDDISRSEHLSAIEDTDIARTITDLKMREMVLQSSMQIGARVLQPSLMQFLG